jgi:hypothetical protein
MTKKVYFSTETEQAGGLRKRKSKASIYHAKIYADIFIGKLYSGKNTKFPLSTK